MKIAKELGRIPRPKTREQLLDEAIDTTLDRYVRIRWRAIEDRVLEKLIAKARTDGRELNSAKAELQVVAGHFKDLDNLIAIKALDGKVGPLPGMRAMQERARNALFLYSRYRDLSERQTAVEHLTNALWIVQGLLDQASMRRYPLVVADALLMSLAARKEAEHFLTAEEKKRFKGDLGEKKNFRDDLNRVHELLESIGYRLRWQEYERVVNPSVENEFQLNDIDAQAWG